MKAFVVDPVEPESVMKEVKDQKVELVGILTTHHHWYYLRVVIKGIG